MTAVTDVRPAPPAVPRAFPRLERLAERVLRVERGANVFPIGHVLCYVALLASCLSPFGPRAWWTAAPAIVLLTLLNYSATVGVLHMHAHRPLFVSRLPNRLADLVCCFPCMLSATEMRVMHVSHHHRFDNGPRDVTSTVGYETGGRAVWYWLRFPWRVKAACVDEILRRADSPARRTRRRQLLFDEAVVIGTVTALTVAWPYPMLAFYWLPFVLTLLTSGYFAWLTHAPATGRAGDSASINTVGNVLNFFVFNQGFHSVHHRYPGIHWTEIPDKLAILLDVDDDVVVSYWVTLDTAWRIAAPERFREPEFGAAWKRRLAARLATGSCRSRLLPYFVKV
ncbi:MAG TPA: fatty acid desaturase [Mycobacteriales bacterium]